MPQKNQDHQRHHNQFFDECLLEVLHRSQNQFGAVVNRHYLDALPETRLVAIQQQIEKNYPDGVPGNLTRGRGLGGT